MKKDRSVIKLVLSIVSLMIGVIWAGATIIVLGSRGTDVPLWRFIVLIAFTILFFFLGVRGLLRWNRARREGGKKIGKAVPILLGVVAVLLVSQMALVFPSMIQDGKMYKALKPYVKEEFSDVEIMNIGDSKRQRRIIEGTEEARSIVKVLKKNGFID